MPDIKRIRNIFVTRLTEVMFDGHGALNAALGKEVAARRSQEAGIVRSNRHGWHSEADFFLRKEPAHIDLARRIARTVRAATEQVADADSKSWTLSYGGWININGKGGHNAPHDHPGAFWSGVYYVTVPQGSGHIEFLDPRPTPAVQDVLQAPEFAAGYKVRPRPGMFLLFPSTLRHWVEPNEGDDERISIAINAMVKPAA